MLAGIAEQRAAARLHAAGPFKQLQPRHSCAHAQKHAQRTAGRTRLHAAGASTVGADGLPDNGSVTGQPHSNASSMPLSGGSNEQAVASSGGKAPVPLLHRVKRFFLGDKMDKERLAALGMGAFCSYGVISNINYGTCLAIAWLGFVKKYGVAPTAPGQFSTFLAFYAGLWAVQNFARPLRLSLALALAPVFDRIMDKISAKTGLAKRWAFGIVLISIVVVTCSVLFGSLWLLGGFPAAK